MAKHRTTRDRLIDAAYELARRKGFDRTSIAEVMEAADVGKGSLYHHFPDKDSLGLAVLERDREVFMAMIDGCLAASTPLEGLDRFFTTALEKHREARFVGGCLWGNTALEMSDSNPAYARLVTAVFDEWIGKIADTIRTAQDTGVIRDDFPAVDLARSVVATIEGGIMLSRLTKEEAPLRASLASLRAMLTASAPQSTASGEAQTQREPIQATGER
ncbi:MAG: TetR/AcrR family transcriptional regulator [Lentisphaeria bacterium]|nr:TetR/AcrR family transcriptional regulator [Lentisphaeria bacterium]